MEAGNFENNWITIAKIVAKEENWTQRKMLEGIETLRLKNQGIVPLNQYNQMEQWKGVLHSLFDYDEVNTI